MKKLLTLLLALTNCGNVLASANFVSNPALPYPPACPFNGQGEWIAFAEDADFTLPDRVTSEPMGLSLSAYRSGCSEPGRSLIWLRISAPEGIARPFRVELPVVVAETEPHHRYLMNLVTTPNSWGANSDPSANGRDLVYYPDRQLSGDGPPTWLFLLDNAESTSDTATWHFTADQYNAAFRLIFRYPPYDTNLSLDIPSTQSLELTPAVLPFSGRLSGNWVSQGAADQGVVIAISSRVYTVDSPGAKRHSPGLVIFFAHYTYDAQGRLLWLTGAADIEPGSNVVSIPIERVVNGEFMGDRTAEREVIGEVQLTTRSCNDIRFDYDYSRLGLGAGSDRLQRLFSLETAGYDCRDVAARVAANR